MRDMCDFDEKTKLRMEEKREKVREFIRKNPRCTYLNIKCATKIKVERIYQNMRKTYEDADVPFSPSLSKRSRIEQKQGIIHYIKNPNCTVFDIRREVGANVVRLFGGIRNAYLESGVPYPKREAINGVANPKIVERSHRFERKILSLFGKLGEVTPHLKTENGRIDFMFELKMGSM